jgi:NodT family efflux transporter outer membrane factor (OMF) lipoprotein
MGGCAQGAAAVRARSHLRALLVAAAVVAMTACTEVGPDYVRPSTHVPAAYKEATASDAGAASIAGAWWTVYHDPVLDGLVAQVRLGNQSLAAAAARVSEAQALVRVASGAAKPEVGIGTFKSGRKSENDFGLGVSWELDLWGRIRRDTEAHRAAAEASEADLAAATLSMQAQLAQAYFALRADDALIDLMQHTVDVDARWQQMVQNQHVQGVASRADAAAALMRHAATRQQLADIRTRRAQLEHAIAVMLGRQPEAFTIAPAPFDTMVPAVPAGLPATLLERRPDVRASERRMAAASARIGVSKAEELPSISLAAGIGVRKGPTATADVHAPLFAGGRLSAQVDNSRAAYAEAVANYRQTVLDAFREVEDGLVAANALAGNAELQAKAAAAAAASARAVQNQYREGVADYAAVVDADGTALDASRAALQLRQRRLDTSVDLIKALGGGWQPEAGHAPASGPAPSLR